MGVNIIALTTGSYERYQVGEIERCNSILGGAMLSVETNSPSAPWNRPAEKCGLPKSRSPETGGFSVYKSALGRSPRLPNILADSLPALNAAPTSTKRQYRRTASAHATGKMGIPRCGRHPAYRASDNRKTAAAGHSLRCPGIGPTTSAFPIGADRVLWLKHAASR